MAEIEAEGVGGVFGLGGGEADTEDGVKVAPPIPAVTGGAEGGGIAVVYGEDAGKIAGEGAGDVGGRLGGNGEVGARERAAGRSVGDGAGGAEGVRGGGDEDVAAGSGGGVENVGPSEVFELLLRGAARPGEGIGGLGGEEFDGEDEIEDDLELLAGDEGEAGAGEDVAAEEVVARPVVGAPTDFAVGAQAGLGREDEGAALGEGAGRSVEEQGVIAASVADGVGAGELGD